MPDDGRLNSMLDRNPNPYVTCHQYAYMNHYTRCYVQDIVH